MNRQESEVALLTLLRKELNCKCMSRFDTSGTSKNETPPKVSVHHGMKKYVNKICLLCLLTEIWLFVYIL